MANRAIVTKLSLFDKLTEDQLDELVLGIIKDGRLIHPGDWDNMNELLERLCEVLWSGKSLLIAPCAAGIMSVSEKIEIEPEELSRSIERLRARGVLQIESTLKPSGIQIVLGESDQEQDV